MSCAVTPRTVPIDKEIDDIRPIAPPTMPGHVNTLHTVIPPNARIPMQDIAGDPYTSSTRIEHRIRYTIGRVSRALMNP